MKLSGWGRYPIYEATVRTPRSEAAIQEIVARGHAIARGNGRSYGDSAVSVGNTVHMKHFNRLLDFDSETGVLVAEAGVLLSDIIEVLLPRGWFPWVTPGTKFVTVGGLVAADVHGKNHHRHGGFGNYVEWLDLMGADGITRRCSRRDNAELFTWTIGGMGLTGIIIRVAFRLRLVTTGWIRQTTIAARHLDEAIAAFEAHASATYSVAWIDCLARGENMGRSLIMLGEHATADEIGGKIRGNPLAPPVRRKWSMPFCAPQWILNRHSVSAFNALYYRAGLRKSGQVLVDWDTYFYPLDALEGWNRIYGRRGFVQFQCVIPGDAARAGLAALLAAITKAEAGSFLGVLKKLGPSVGGLSFPMEGYTLALDFAANVQTFALLSVLERIVAEAGGRFYLAKDAVLAADGFHASDRRVADFCAFRVQLALGPAFESAQSRRLAI